MVNSLRISFFDRALLPLYANHQAQTYFSISLYLFVAILLCGILAILAYLFSLSSAQDSEKRSEYECGFEPFDNATRLPFDVHFYLVGILFLIFDVEIALLFPWVLGLRNIGWFGFYLIIGFIVILAVGFLYEWKRGALIWPSRQQETPYVHSFTTTTSTRWPIAYMQANLFASFMPAVATKKWNVSITLKAHDRFIKKLENYLTKRDSILNKVTLDTVESYLTTLKFIRNTVLTSIKLLTPFRVLAESLQRSERKRGAYNAISATVEIRTRTTARLYALIAKIITHGRTLYRRFETDKYLKKEYPRYLCPSDTKAV